MKTKVHDFFKNEMVKFRVFFSKKTNSLHLGSDQSPQDDVILVDLAWFFHVDKMTSFFRLPRWHVFVMYEAS